MKILKNFEIAHYVSKNISIFSKKNIVAINFNSTEFTIKLPRTFFDIFSFSRVLRRFFRLDKCNVYLLDDQDLRLVIIRFGKLYYYDRNIGLIKTLSLKNCRNILHVDIGRLPNGDICFGEYGSNNKRSNVPIYLSKNNGLNWEVIYEFPPNSIKHIHVVKYDKFSDTIWCCTGDNDGENKIIVFNKSFDIINEIGDGSQYFRTCDLFFTDSDVVWLMDSPNIKSHVIKFNRSSKSIEIGQELAGPVWYSTTVGDSFFLAATSVEPGYSMDHKTAYLLASKDLTNWQVIKSYKKDFLPIDLFKYGVIAFPLGEFNKSSVYIFGEALINLDGRIEKINLNDVFP
jgi:hypothetical protein